MPEANQYAFSHREIVTLLIKAAGVHEGKWMLQMRFGFTAGNFGASADQVHPGAIVAVQEIGIQKAPDGSAAALVVDASVVNPKPA